VIISELYEGQGLGNQLWTYAVTRSLATVTNQPYAILSSDRFKLRNELVLDWGKKVYYRPRNSPTKRSKVGRFNVYHEDTIRHIDDKFDLTDFDPNLMNLTGKWRIEGNFQNEKYLKNLKKEITQWFSLPKPSNISADSCTINFRGGEYSSYPKLLLPRSYYYQAMEYIKVINPMCEFNVVTDDVKLAREYFPDLAIFSKEASSKYPIKKKIRDDMAVLQSSRYLILSNSSFSWWGAWTNPDPKHVVAPKYWARFNDNDGHWSTAGAITSGWSWQDSNGGLFTYDECLSDFKEFQKSRRYRGFKVQT
jgi:hypothetical protein